MSKNEELFKRMEKLIDMIEKEEDKKTLYQIAIIIICRKLFNTELKEITIYAKDYYDHVYREVIK